VLINFLENGEERFEEEAESRSGKERR